MLYTYKSYHHAKFILNKLFRKKDKKLAVIIHLYYIELWPQIAKHLENINVPFDVFVSVQSKNKEIQFSAINKFHNQTIVKSFINRGRDVLPFLSLLAIIFNSDKYDYFLKIHSKKSLHRKDGSEWLDSLLSELIPVGDVSEIIKTLERFDTGAIGPSSHLVSLSRYLGDNKNSIETILSKLIPKENVEEKLNKASLYPFFGGTMFWARVDMFSSILNLSLSEKDFDKENGQVDGTLAHALERVFGGLLHSITKKKMYSVNREGVQQLSDRLYEEEYRFVG